MPRCQVVKVYLKDEKSHGCSAVAFLCMREAPAGYFFVKLSITEEISLTIADTNSSPPISAAAAVAKNKISIAERIQTRIPTKPRLSIPRLILLFIIFLPIIFLPLDLILPYYVKLLA